jgi:spermidine synthase
MYRPCCSAPQDGVIVEADPPRDNHLSLSSAILSGNVQRVQGKPQMNFNSLRSAFLAGKPYVEQDGNELTLQFGPTSIQSCLNPDEPDRLLLGYTRTLLGFLLFVQNPHRMTMIGLGGGALPKYCYRHFPDCHIDVVEINLDVIALRDTFRVPADDIRFAVHCADGADYVARLTGTEDVLIVDGFDVGGQAPTLCTESFYHDCFKALAEGGVMAVNLSENAKQHAGFIKRMRHCFHDKVIVVNAEDCTNKIVFAIKHSGSNTSNSLKDLLQRATQLDKQHPVAFRQIVERMGMNRHNTFSDNTFTDNTFTE